MPDMLAIIDLCRLPNVILDMPYPSIGKAAVRTSQRCSAIKLLGGMERSKTRQIAGGD
jgi:hypothetical protein